MGVAVLSAFGIPVPPLLNLERKISAHAYARLTATRQVKKV
jgi:hypothetical protein